MSVPEMVELAARIDKLQVTLDAVLARFAGPAPGRQFLTIDEFAKEVKRTPYTVREWARLGQINAIKRDEHRGGHRLWSVSREELVRYQNEGLLTLDPQRNTGS